VLVDIAAAGVLGQVDLDHVLRALAQQLRPQLGVDHVVGRGDHRFEGADALGVVVQCAERFDLGHGRAP
jgi:hypothetical protein